MSKITKGLLASAGVMAGNVYAAVPASVTAATADLQADAVTIATVFLVATIALAAFVFMKRGAK